MDTEFKEIAVSSLILDIDNPRFSHLRKLHSSELSEDSISEIIEKDSGTKELFKSIKKSGVQDPIWVQERDLSRVRHRRSIRCSSLSVASISSRFCFRIIRRSLML